MIAIVRMQAQGNWQNLWNEIVNRKDAMQKAIHGKGQLIYISKRSQYSEVSLFIHARDLAALADCITEQLTSVKEITGLWTITMLKPVFFPIPENVHEFKRYSLTLNVFPAQLGNVYNTLKTIELPHGMKMSYLAYTFHLLSDSIMTSVLARDESHVTKIASEIIGKLPGVLKVNTNLVEKTLTLTTQAEWKEYVAKHEIKQVWDHNLMLQQFDSK